MTVEFGLFNSACVLPQFPGDEHRRIMDEVAIVQAADRVGFKYTWATEHHFLTEYSHLSANEVFLGYLAAATRRIHLGSGIFNVTPPVNHPARVAERVAMLDHLSEGRFEFGMGRGSSTTEQKGFGITDPDLTRDMFDEVVGEFRKMWRAEEYPGFDGKFFSMPPRNVLPKPYSTPHPPMWVAAGNPSTFEKAARMGLGVLCFTIGGPESVKPLVELYKNEIAERGAGRRLRERQHHGDDAAAVPRRRPARARPRRRPRAWGTTAACCCGTSTRSRARPAFPSGPSSCPTRRPSEIDAVDRGGRHAVRHARRGRGRDPQVRRRRRRPGRVRAAVVDDGARPRDRDDRDVRQARAAAVRHRPGAPHDAQRERGVRPKRVERLTRRALSMASVSASRRASTCSIDTAICG